MDPIEQMRSRAAQPVTSDPRPLTDREKEDRAMAAMQEAIAKEGGVRSVYDELEQKKFQTAGDMYTAASFGSALLSSGFWTNDIPSNVRTSLGNAMALFAGFASDAVGAAVAIRAADPMAAGARELLGINSAWDAFGQIPWNSADLAETFGGDVNHPSFIINSLITPGPEELAHLAPAAKATVIGMIGNQNAGMKYGRMFDFLKKRREGNVPNYDAKTFQETKWFTGADGLPRIILSDADASLRMDNIKGNAKVLAAIKKFPEGSNDVFNFRVKDILIHDKVLEAYPELANMQINIAIQWDNAGNLVFKNPNKIPEFRGETKMAGNEIRGIVTHNLDNAEDLLETVLHELGHTIQTIEGFQNGGSAVISKNAINQLIGTSRGSEILGLIDDGIDSIDGLAKEMDKLGYTEKQIRKSLTDPFINQYMLADDVARGAAKWEMQLQHNRNKNDIVHLLDYLGIADAEASNKLATQLGNLIESPKLLKELEFQAYENLLGEAEVRLLPLTMKMTQDEIDNALRPLNPQIDAPGIDPNIKISLGNPEKKLQPGQAQVAQVGK